MSRARILTAAERRYERITALYRWCILIAAFALFIGTVALADAAILWVGESAP